MMVRLPGDHTAGRAPGGPTARAVMADHDYALGRLVEAVSRSEAWGQNRDLRSGRTTPRMRRPH